VNGLHHIEEDVLDLGDPEARRLDVGDRIPVRLRPNLAHKRAQRLHHQVERKDMAAGVLEHVQLAAGFQHASQRFKAFTKNRDRFIFPKTGTDLFFQRRLRCIA